MNEQARQALPSLQARFDEWRNDGALLWQMRLLQSPRTLVFEDETMEEAMKLLDGGNDTGRLNLICVAEGYTEKEHKLFEAHARQLVAQIEAEGWYRKGLLNVHSLFVESKESTFRLKPDGQPVDSAFGAHYGGDRAGHVISGNDKIVRMAVFDGPPLQWPHVHIAVLVNCKRYGGRGGGADGGMFWTYTDLHNPRRWTSCALHEWGHVLGLADEYGSGFGYAKPSPRTKEPEQPNITLDPRGAKWRHIVDGAVDGADGYDLGIYRPTRNCRMRTVGSFPFCPVCEDHITRELEGYQDDEERDPPAKQPEPPQSTATVGDPPQQTFAVTVPGTVQKTKWFPDDLAGIMAANQWLLERKFG